MKKWIATFALLATLAGTASATDSWMAKCQSSSGNCACCILAYIEAAFASLGGWN